MKNVLSRLVQILPRGCDDWHLCCLQEPTRKLKADASRCRTDQCPWLHVDPLWFGCVQDTSSCQRTQQVYEYGDNANAPVAMTICLADRCRLAFERTWCVQNTFQKRWILPRSSQAYLSQQLTILYHYRRAMMASWDLTRLQREGLARPNWPQNELRWKACPSVHVICH